MTVYDALFARLGHEFENVERLEQALTHRSASHGQDIGYERLEFLGDRILGLCIADMLMQAFPEEPEGALSRRLNALVRQETLAEIAAEIGLNDYLRLGKAEEESGASDNPAILADVCEAVIAALYRDSGLDASRRFIKRYWEKRLEKSSRPPKDAKSSLQEWAMARKIPLPEYETIEKEGPDHAPVFTIQVSVRGKEPAQATGDSKRSAEQKAAEILLNRLLGDIK
ncbi:ribonuclease III [Aestuariispira insulae]|uniref:Ribonuclease 3 n=1 Tax=Aestuariispira insulae TaxID=1461337 RepID=A0A3D9HNL9_9PROT|nr:ribonuclease III [Aestuariispira insulae]RED50891.1 RNAse III [Aestuariispira insulae]